MLGEFLNAVSAVVVLLMLMAVGYFMGTKGWMKAEEKKFLSKYIINIAVPCNCINGLLNNLDQSMLAQAGLMLVSAIIGVVITILLGMGLATLLRLPKNRWGVFAAMVGVSNTLFIGLPLSTQLFGDVCVPYVMIYYLANTIFTQSVILMLVERSGTASHSRGIKGFLKDVFTKPPILTVIASVLMLIVGFRPPEVFMSFAKYISGSVSPLALIYCGFIIYELGLSNLRPSQLRQMKKLLDMAEQLSERYLISEVMELPEQAEDQVYYQLLKMAGKSMLEQVGEVERERLEYKEYIEQWIHEIKTPITAMKLLCENHRMDWTKELLLELEKTNRFTEQALYYARSEHTEKDYSVREMVLSQVVHGAIADNKYLLLHSGMRLEVEEMQDTVYSDEKWVRFILNQLIANAVKYRTKQPVLRISTHKRQDQVVLVVEDNGIGIAASDLPRIFEKGFTGQNGRMVQQSTGIGLYLCKRLCEKLGIGITAESSEHGTAVSLSFHINCLIHEVQS